MNNGLTLIGDKELLKEIVDFYWDKKKFVIASECLMFYFIFWTSY